MKICPGLRKGALMKRQRRIELTGEILKHFFDDVFKGEVSEFSSCKGLPYGLIYNLVHGRISSISASDYRRIFGQDPPEQEPKRVSGEYFRGMVRLWLFLNEKVTEKDLHREFHAGNRPVKKTDYRIFSGATRTVERRLERSMEQKFLDQGLSPAEIQAWVRELDSSRNGGRVPFATVKPILARLEENLKVHPTRLLNRWIAKYESGELKTISKKIYQRLLELDLKAEEAAARPSRLKFEKLREEVYGSKEGLVLFSEVEEELEFLRTWGRKSPKKYLGRSIGKYRRGILKRVPNWRERMVREDCEKLIREQPLIPLKALPKRYRERAWQHLTATLEAFLVARMLSKDTICLENDVLKPVYHTKTGYESGGYGFVNVQEAARIAGMSEKAFGLLMAEHSDIFKRIGRHEGNWCIPDLYLAEISQREVFPLIKRKYEWLAGNARKIPSTRIQCGAISRRRSHSGQPEAGKPLHSTGGGGVISISGCDQESGQERLRGSTMRRSPS
jgi:hypothetical protein